VPEYSSGNIVVQIPTGTPLGFTGHPPTTKLTVITRKTHFSALWFAGMTASIVASGLTGELIEGKYWAIGASWALGLLSAWTGYKAFVKEIRIEITIKEPAPAPG